MDCIINMDCRRKGMANIIDAIINLINNPVIELNKEYVNERNRANNMGDALEEYMKDLFAGTVNITDRTERLKIHSDVFSYLGNQNNPPDFILNGGDAVEVKKIESPNSSLALNSSYPKHKLHSGSPMITRACRECEQWSIKDIIYAVGILGTDKKTLRSLAFVYGEDYAASEEIYEKIRTKIKDGVETIPEVEFQETNELGRVNRVDPLGITYLRIRGMWGIENPFRVFDYVYERDNKFDFNFMTIINEEKWDTFSRTNELIELISRNSNSRLDQVKIKCPDNPAKLKKAYVISLRI